jgi:hypothetical protein
LLNNDVILSATFWIEESLVMLLSPAHDNNIF